ncbi:hypothetical protein [Candidatus Hodarchaeum mangrovi]
MSIDPTYIKAAIETLDLIHRLLKNLSETQTINKLNDFLSQIEAKADARVSSSLGQSLGIDLPVADREGKSPKFWEGVRDMARLVIKQWTVHKKNPETFSSFLSNTGNNLKGRIGLEEDVVSPLEGILKEKEPIAPEEEPVSPLEEMIQSEPTSTPAPSPTPITPKPEPIPVQEVPKPKPIPIQEVPKPKPIPSPIIPKNETVPKPVKPKPEPVIAEMPVSRIEPRIPDISPAPDKFGELDKKIQSASLEEPESPKSSLADKLLKSDEISDKSDEDDDMLSLSLREALKILRDEDDE